MRRPAIVAALVALAILGTDLASQAAIYRLAPGLTLRAMRWHGGQWRVESVDLSLRHIRAVPAGPSLPNVAEPSRLANHAGALATSASDFMMGLGPASAFPAHMLVVNREVWSTGEQGPGTAYVQAPGHAWIEPVSFFAQVRRDGKRPTRVAWVNGYRPRGDRIVAWTSRDHWVRHAVAGCTVVLASIAPTRWTEGKVGTSHRYRVVADADPCIARKPSAGRVVLNANPGTRGASQLRSFAVGETATWYQTLGHPGVTDIVGGWPRIIRSGRNVGPACVQDCKGRGDARGYVYGSLPRFALGVSESGTRAYIVTVDFWRGHPSWSTGATFGKLASYMRTQLHIYNAVALDGGGSVMNWTRRRGSYCQTRKNGGCLVNRPAYGRERTHMYATAVF